jgi:excisionase family DNA binding protein
MTMEKIMTAKELSQFLKLSESTIYKLASNGEIPGFKIGDSWRFELEEIQKLIRDSKKKGRKQRDPVEEGGEKKTVGKRTVEERNLADLG